MVYNLRQGGQGRAHRRDDVEQWLKDMELVIEKAIMGNSVPRKWNSKSKGPEVGVSGVFEKQQGSQCSWSRVMREQSRS